MKVELIFIKAISTTSIKQKTTMVATNKYTKPAEGGADADSPAFVLVPIAMPNPAEAEVINLKSMNEQDVKCLQTKGE